MAGAARAAIRALHRRRVDQAGLGDLRDPEPRDRQAARRADPGERSRRRSRRAGGPSRAARVGGARRPRARAAPLRSRAPHPEAEPVLRGARVARQRQADPGVARHRRTASGAALLSPRRLGAADGAGAAGTRAGRRDRSDHSMELPAADAGVEDRARARDGKHGGAQARRVHLADGAALRRAVRGSGNPARRGEHHHR